MVEILRLCSLLVAFLSAALVSDLRAQHQRVASPRGGCEVEFRELEHKRHTQEDLRRSLDQVSHVKYEVSFFPKGESQSVATVEYCDVYGWEPDAKPAPLTVLVRVFLWSPNEDFVVLDEEGWARAPGAPDRRAVALNPELPWRVAPFQLSEPAWIDSMRVVGNAYNDCDYAVQWFDGRTGETRPIREAASPIGYELVSVTGSSVLIRKLLDNCKSVESEKTFVPECLSIDLDTMRATSVDCPTRP